MLKNIHRYLTLDSMALLYLILPFILFSGGFLKIYIAIPSIVFTIYCFIKIVNGQKPVLWKSEIHWHNLLLFTVALFICWHCGVGEYWVQHSDFWVKNPLLNDLAERPWPLTFTYEGKTIGFSYYLFPYLVPALLGKLYMEFLHPAALLWASLGLFFVFRYLYELLNVSKYKVGIWILVFAFICFSGLEILGGALLHLIEGQTMFGGSGRLALAQEDWCAPYFSLYASNISSLIVCYNQCISTWLVVMLIIQNRESNYLGFYYSLILLYSPWAAIGAFPIILYTILRNLIKSSRISSLFSQISWQNVGFPVLLLFIVGSYYISSSGSSSESGWFFEFVSIPYFVRHYISFLVFEVLFYFMFLRIYWRNNFLLQGSLFVLMLLPFYKMTPVNDLLMRASIPALFVICYNWIRYVMESNHKRYILFSIIFLSGLTPMEWALSQDYHYLKGLSPKSQSRFQSFQNLDKLDNSLNYFQETTVKQFFVQNPEEQFFWKYLAK